MIEIGMHHRIERVVDPAYTAASLKSGLLEVLATPIMIAWMDNWETCKEAPRRHPWYAQMSVPREVFMRDGRLMQRPVREIEGLWQDTVRHDSVTVCEETSLPKVQGRLLDMTVTLHAQQSACRRFTLHVAAVKYQFAPG